MGANDIRQLNKLFMKINQNILQIISTKNNLGCSTTKEKYLLKMIREQLDFMVNNSYQLATSGFEYIFRASKLQKSLRQLGLNGEEAKIIERITENFMGNIIQSSIIAYNELEKVVKNTRKEIMSIGGATSVLDDLYKKTFVENITKQGLTGFIDKSGKHWSLGAYTNMVLRTSVKTTQNYGVLYTYEHIDLYKISKHNSVCPICAPLEGRVYSRSGKNKNYPPLALAFGKINPNGTNDLSNTYLNIHPNCQHALIPFTEDFKSKKQIEEIREFSSFESNPPSRDPRSEKQIQQYKKQQEARNKLLNDFKQFQQMKLKLGTSMPKTFQTFQKHKLKGSENYKNWLNTFNNG